MRVRIASIAGVLAAVALAAAGCGGHGVVTPSPKPTPHVSPSTSCVVPPVGQGKMGECVASEVSSLRLGSSLGRAKVSGSFGAQGLDISQWQGVPCWSCAKAAGLRFVYGQSNDGTFRQWNFVTNWVRLRQLGVAHGAYVFARPGCASCQALTLANEVRAAGGMDRLALPPAVDAEVPGAYCNVAPIAFWIRRYLHVSTVLTYTSPGLWACGHATGGTRLWTAVWWNQGPYPPPGSWGYSDIKAWQYCGVGCHFPGVSGQVDRDVDRGVLALVKPPCNHRCQVTHKRHELRGREGLLRALEGRHRALARVIHRYHCDVRRHKHAALGPRCRRWFGEGDRVGAHARLELKRIHRLHREGIR